MATNTDLETPEARVADFDIRGLTCASCVRRVERALTRVAGVREASVNLATEQAHVTYDAAVVDPADLSAAVERAGYIAQPVHAVSESPANLEPESAGGDSRAEERDRETRVLRRRSLVSLTVGVAMMGLMYLPLNLDMRLVAPVLLIAATVVQFWAGGTFYRAAWAAAKHGGTTMNTLVAAGTSVAYGYSAFITLWPSL